VTATSWKAARVAVYARYSTDKQREASIEDQIRRCREFARSRGGRVADELIFSDRAVSGGSTAGRRGFEDLMRLATSKPPLVDVIVTEDMSRISRDLADSALIFKRLQFAKVQLVGVADGVDTSARGAKMQFTLKSLMSDLYLDELRDKTLRGLEGRALAGMATGGLPYGFRSVQALDAYGKVAGHRVEIDESRAKTIRWIFDRYLAGMSLAAIAIDLNRRAVEAPRARSKHRYRGWVDSTIRAMLHNEKYAGVWRFKTTQWIKDPETGQRKCFKRPADEVIVDERPELRIVDAQTWQAVKDRLASVHAHYTRNVEGRASTPLPKTYYPLSSILICGECEHPMLVYGGGSTSYYRCGHAVRRGTCANRLSVREEIARERILAAIRDTLTSDEGLAHARKRIVERLRASSRGRDAELNERRALLTRTEARIKGLVGFIADGDRSEAVVSGLRDLEAHARAERGTIAELELNGTKPIELPSVDKITARVFDLEARLRREPAVAREQLKGLLRASSIRLDVVDGRYIARGTLFPLGLMLIPKTQHAAEGYSAAYYGFRSGGEIRECIYRVLFRFIRGDTRTCEVIFGVHFRRLFALRSRCVRVEKSRQHVALDHDSRSQLFSPNAASTFAVVSFSKAPEPGRFRARTSLRTALASSVATPASQLSSGLAFS
jgi:DNA invertase Pin-like site-specific DNA recombinase